MLSSVLTTPRRIALFALVGVGLFLAPLWFPPIHVGDPAYTYEAAQVTPDHERGIGYVDGDAPRVTSVGRISDEIACSSGPFMEIRTCALERHVAENNTVPSGISTVSTEVSSVLTADQYRYVAVNDRVYETAYEVNESARNEGEMNRIDLALEPVPAEEALRDVSVDASSDQVSPVVAEAAREGTARSRERVDVPQTPVRLEDGTYYRVYEYGTDNPSTFLRVLGDALPFLVMGVGVLMLVRLADCLEVTYTPGNGRQ